MSRDVIRKIFSSGFFVMPHAFDVPVAVLKPIGLKSFRIKSGNYIIIENHEYIIIDF